ncbi:uncharacterized protein LOC141615381 [Silene latifolia]|uniref:uncharacterized protein LOC141615381 n=1 Tax=Silene latifolia TaxID=37657 RepID=UPI003D776DF1
MDYMSFLLNLAEFLVLDDHGVDDEDLVNWIMSMGEPYVYTIHMIKDRGNSLFKDGNFSLAGSLYKFALEFFCFIAIPPSQDQPLATSLALSLVLNLAACELKLFHYNETRCFCNLVLNFDPSNVKALYRRGFALKNLNLFAEAFNDLQFALKLDPKNKEVARELSCVTECLLLNPNGKRVACPFDSLGKDRKGKKPLLDVALDNKFVAIDAVSDASCSKMELSDNDNEISCVLNHGSGSSVISMDSTITTEPYPPGPCQLGVIVTPQFPLPRDLPNTVLPTKNKPTKNCIFQPRIM